MHHRQRAAADSGCDDDTGPIDFSDGQMMRRVTI